MVIILHIGIVVAIWKGGKTMLWSNERKLALSGWLNENHRSSYSSSLKLQKFLFFYECFSKVDGEEHDFSNLKG